MSTFETTGARLLEVARRGTDAEVIDSLPVEARQALRALLDEVDRALDRGQTLVEESCAADDGTDDPAARGSASGSLLREPALRRVAFDAADALAHAARAATRVPRDDASAGCIRLILRAEWTDADAIGRSAYLLRGSAPNRRIAMARCADDERRLAEALKARIATPTTGPARASCTTIPRDPSDRTAPDSADPEAPQRFAVASARARGLLILTGGPGTGKTRTIARIVASFMAARATPAPPRVHVLAPTGRAAARLREQLESERAMAAGEVRASAETATGASESATVIVSTIHSALCWRPALGAPFAHTARNPLPSDLVIVDECSMVDLSLMRRLVEAVPLAASLVLVGDADQLASIGSGSVFSDCCASETLRSSVVRLEHNFRTQGDPNAAWLASIVRSVREGDADAAIAALRSAGALIEPASAPGSRTRVAVELALPEYERLLDESRDDPLAAFDSLRRFRVLCATRQGDGGVESISGRLDDRLFGTGRRVGRQIMILANDREADLANGDLGVVTRDGVIVGRRDDGSPRLLPRSTLPEHEAAWAISIHKSQGSEFDRVVVVLPPPPSPILSRELLYTALTRSRGLVHVIASAASVRAAVERPIRRASGLREVLDGEAEPRREEGGAPVERGITSGD